MDKALFITAMRVEDIRFPTSREAIGSDAMNTDPDYSAAYVILETSRPGLEGHGLTFTIGRGNEICTRAIEALEHLVVGLSLSEIAADMAGFWKRITGDSQLRWLGPDKGVIHLATGAVVNAVWDLYAKSEGKPLWQVLCDMNPEQLVSCVDFSYLTDALTPEEALALLRKAEPGKAERLARLRAEGYPGYTTSAGWLGYSDEKIRTLVRQAKAEGWKHLKMKVGSNLQDDIRRAGIITEETGGALTLMMDANQKWEVNQAIDHMKELARFRPFWIEEPTSPDDILGHAAIARAIAKRPDILLCDEPTGALDSQTGILVLQAIEHIHAELGTTTALITHNAVIADIADRVLIFGDGRVVEQRRNDHKRRAGELSW